MRWGKEGIRWVGGEERVEWVGWVWGKEGVGQVGWVEVKEGVAWMGWAEVESGRGVCVGFGRVGVAGTGFGSTR